MEVCANQSWSLNCQILVTKNSMTSNSKKKIMFIYMIFFLRIWCHGIIFLHPGNISLLDHWLLEQNVLLWLVDTMSYTVVQHFVLYDQSLLYEGHLLYCSQGHIPPVKKRGNFCIRGMIKYVLNISKYNQICLM